MAPAAVPDIAEKLKEEGNAFFKKERFGPAIDAYTEAIALCPDVPVYWTNRALCHRKRNDWTRVEEDCRRAIQLDHNSVKVRLTRTSVIILLGNPPVEKINGLTGKDASLIQTHSF